MPDFGIGCFEMKFMAGIHIYDGKMMPPRYMALGGLVDLAEGLVKLLTFGFVSTDWSLRYAIWWTSRPSALQRQEQP